MAELQQGGHTVAVCSSDDFYVCKHCGKYEWSADRIGYAHGWCRAKFREALAAGTQAVFVDNTNVTVREVRPYVEMALEFGYEVQFLEPATPWAFDVDELVKRNVHGVPREGIERMLRRWVPDMTVEKALRTEPQPGEMTADESGAAA